MTCTRNASDPCRLPGGLHNPLMILNIGVLRSMHYAFCTPFPCVLLWFRGQSHALIKLCIKMLCIMRSSTVGQVTNTWIEESHVSVPDGLETRRPYPIPAAPTYFHTRYSQSLLSFLKFSRLLSPNACYSSLSSVSYCWVFDMSA